MGGGALRVCQNGAKVENATAHAYNVADMRDSQRGRDARVEGRGQAGSGDGSISQS